MTNFTDWLIKEKKLSDKVSRDNLSRLKRVVNLYAGGSIKKLSKKNYSEIIEKINSCEKFSISVRSQLKRAVNLYHEFINN